MLEGWEFDMDIEYVVRCNVIHTNCERVKLPKSLKNSGSIKRAPNIVWSIG